MAVSLMLLGFVVLGVILLWRFTLVPTTPSQSPTQFINGMDWLPAGSGRSMNTVVIAGRGSGKSICVYKEMVWRDLLAGLAQFIFEPVSSSDYLFDKLARAKSTMSPAAYDHLKSRIYYLDFSGGYGYVPAWPLIYRWPGESHFAAAQKFIDTVVAMDPNLASAAIMGESAIRQSGTAIATLCSILGLQLTEAIPILDNPKNYQPLLEEALRRSPEAVEPVRWFREYYIPLKSEPQKRATESLRNKLLLLSEPTTRAIFGANRPDNWLQQRLDEGACVIISTAGITDSQRKLFTMMTAFDTVIGFKLSLGQRSPACSIVLEEMPQWLPYGPVGDVMAGKLDTLFNVYARNYQLYITAIFQDLVQLTPQMQNVMLSAGNLMLGNLESFESRMRLSESLLPFDGRPLPPKRWDPVYAGGELIDVRPVDWTAAEVMHLRANCFKMKPFHFLVRSASEGDTVSSGGLRPMRMRRNLGEYVQKDAVEALKREVVPNGVRSCGLALTEVNGRLQALLQAVTQSATLGQVTTPVDHDEPAATNPATVDVVPAGHAPGAAFRLRPTEEGESNA